MLNEPRIYRHPTGQFVILFLVFAFLAIGIFTSFDNADAFATIPFAALFVFVVLLSIYSITAKATISNDKISSQSIFGTRTLTWSEINRVSGKGHAIKLHNLDGDVTVAPSPRLPGYEEIVEWIGTKRPDLFSPQEYNEMTRGWAGYILLAVVVLFMIGTGFFLVTQASAGFMLFIFFFIVALFMAFVTLSLPQSLSIDGNTLLIKYFFNERSLRANEIASISLNYTRTRNGKSYFVRLDLRDKGSIRISGIGPNLPIVFLVLRNWHKKHALIGQTNQ